MALAIVQSTSGSQASGTGVPGQPTFGSAVKAGNLIVVFLHTDSAATGITPNASAYAEVGTSVAFDVYATNSYVLTRYAQAGDGTTPPAMATAGSCHWAYVAYEIAGVAGTLAKDLQTVGGAAFINNYVYPPIYQQTPQQAGTLALASGGNYTDNSTISVPAGWTADVNTGTETNWGTLAGLHYSNASAGTPISASVAHMASGAQIILQPSVPTSPYVRSAYNGFQNTANLNTPGQLQAAPTPGNLVIAFVQTPTGLSPTVAAGWTLFDSQTSLGASATYGLYRYAQPGDTATLPAFFASESSSYWGYTAYEVGGVTGQWASDFQSAQHGNTVSSTSITTANGTTGYANTLALIGVSWDLAGATGTAPTVGTGWAMDGVFGSATLFGASKSFASKGSTVSTTFNYASGNTSYIQALFGGKAGPPPGVAGNFMLLGVGT